MKFNQGDHDNFEEYLRTGNNSIVFRKFLFGVLGPSMVLSLLFSIFYFMRGSYPYFGDFGLVSVVQMFSVVFVGSTLMYSGFKLITACVSFVVISFSMKISFHKVLAAAMIGSVKGHKPSFLGILKASGVNDSLVTKAFYLGMISSVLVIFTVFMSINIFYF